MKKISIRERVLECLRRASLSSYFAWCLVIPLTCVLYALPAAGRAAWQELGYWRNLAASGLSRESFAREVLRRRWAGKEFINGGRRCK